MKLTKMALVIAMGLAGISAAQADEGNMGQGTGTVTFHGTIVDAPCSISPDTIDQTVELGEVAKGQLENGGSAAPVPFQIDLQNCSLKDDGSNNTVTVTFNGVADQADTTMLGLNGTAGGAGIVITDGSGSQLDLGTASAGQSLAEGDNQLKFAAYLKGDGAAAVTAGEFSSVANFAMAYQ